jgi:glycosidase
MPKLNIKNPEVYDFLLSVAHYWMKNTAIDGFRLDVPEELPHSFWKDFRKAVKSYNKEAYIVGEIWSDGSKWLAGDQFDGVMNYGLRNALLSFFVKKDIKASELDIKLAADKVNLPDSAFFSMLNLLGSHDTPRILSVCGGDTAALYKMIIFIMTYPGAPCVYYGDDRRSGR